MAEQKDEANRREWLLDTITTEYFERLERGEKPEVDEYTGRYPEVAEEFKANLLYFNLEGYVNRKHPSVKEQRAGYNTETSPDLHDPAERARASKMLDKFGVPPARPQGETGNH